MGKVKGPQNPLADAYNTTKVIQPGANKQTVAGQDNFEKLTGVATKVGNAIMGGINRLNSTGSHRSPSTVRDKK